MDNLNAITVFVRVAEARSFTAAAERLGLTPSAVSKAITRLEKELGVRLLHRSTRLVNLTNDGVGFFEHCREILASVEDAERAVTLAKASPHGRLRIQMPVGFGRRVVMPALRQLSQRHPALMVDAELSDRVADLAYEGFDAAIQIGQVGGDLLVAHEICRLRFTALASPEYLAQHGEPRTPDDLDQHSCLAYVSPLTGGYRPWEFSRDGQTFSRRVSGRLNVNHADSLVEAAIAGMGIVMISNFIAADAIKRGLLKPILSDFVAPGPKVHLVHLPSRVVSLKLRALMESLDETVAAFDQVLEPSGATQASGQAPRPENPAV
jgi:LysR family transcriptional regulator for bpeEF and oprC